MLSIIFSSALAAVHNVSVVISADQTWIVSIGGVLSTPPNFNESNTNYKRIFRVTQLVDANNTFIGIQALGTRRNISGEPGVHSIAGVWAAVYVDGVPVDGTGVPNSQMLISSSIPSNTDYLQSPSFTPGDNWVRNFQPNCSADVSVWNDLESRYRAATPGLNVRSVWHPSCQIADIARNFIRLELALNSTSNLATNITTTDNVNGTLTNSTLNSNTTDSTTNITNTTTSITTSSSSTSTLTLATSTPKSNLTSLPSTNGAIGMQTISGLFTLLVMLLA